jgi:GNAT superfamily N-acetyltransferase
VQSIRYDVAPASLRRAIADLQARAYGPVEPTPEERLQPLHDPSLNARSFFIVTGDRVISYAGVVTKPIRHGKMSLTIAGLACVATDPDYRRRGYGRRTVAAATRFIEGSGVDLGIFTCAPGLARFYAAAGAWPIAPDVVLIGSRDAGALTSTSLGVLVLMRLFSPRAVAAATLRRGTIDLGLPVGRFL